MQLHLLDMGTEKYGDCILITKNNKKILIDGAHPGDEDFIRFQLSKLLKQKPPFHIDLLVVTHCHSDHIGCLPAMVRLGYITVGTALVADPKYRWGNTLDDVAAWDDMAPDTMLAEALDEEDRSDMSDEELEQFVFDAPRLGPGYKEMLDTLAANGTDVIKFNGADKGYAALEKKFSDFGLKILGPTEKHLKITQRSLEIKPKKKDVDAFRESMDAPLSMAEAYRRLVNIENDMEGAADAMNKGAINDQSIVLKLVSDGWSALLCGDMQFAKAEVTGLETEMDKLLEKIYQHTFDFIKTSHHTSYNGLDETMLEKWIGQKTEFFAHTGGLEDHSHPEHSVLEMLKAQKDKIYFARTDRNGIITVAKEQNGQLQMYISKGSFNNFRPNPKVKDAVEEGQSPQPPATVATAPVHEVSQTSSTDADQFVEVITKVPHTSTSVRITIDVDPEKKNLTQGDESQRAAISGNTTGEGDRFNNLVFLTCSQKLRSNIGESETTKLLQLVRSLKGATLVDIPHTEDVKLARKQLQEKCSPATKGVVIIGGYDVIPAMQLDTLSAELREELTDSDHIDDDHDSFIVWSDDTYGDIEGDTLPEMPVSRIPDGKSAELLFNALKARPFSVASKFGIRNLDRPFAVDIFDTIPSSQQSVLEISEKCSPMSIGKDKQKGAVYYMLHGADHDATRFWGESKDGKYYEAIDINNIPEACDGSVVFSGCCWGALTVLPPAYKKTPSIALRPRTPEQSIALAYLKAGALAFVGCTGTHYSPKVPPYNFFGKPMHDAFWKNIAAGSPPARALFEAKKKYAAELPHGLEKPLTKAIELKILRQFTCLGLGW